MAAFCCCTLKAAPGFLGLSLCVLFESGGFSCFHCILSALKMAASLLWWAPPAVILLWSVGDLNVSNALLCMPAELCSPFGARTKSNKSVLQADFSFLWNYWEGTANPTPWQRFFWSTTGWWSKNSAVIDLIYSFSWIVATTTSCSTVLIHSLQLIQHEGQLGSGLPHWHHRILPQDREMCRCINEWSSF